MSVFETMGQWWKDKFREVYAEEAVQYAAENTVEREMGNNKMVLETPTAGATGEDRWDGANLNREPLQQDAITLRFGDYECQANLMAEMYPGTDKEVKTYSYQNQQGQQMMYCQSPYLGDFSYDAKDFAIGYKELPDGQLPILKYVGDVQADWQHSGKSPAEMIGNRPIEDIGNAWGSNAAHVGNRVIDTLDVFGIIPDSPIPANTGYSRDQQVQIPNGVKKLDYTFEGNDQIQLVPAIPASVESLHCAFKDCKALNDVSAQFTQKDSWEIPASVQDATYAFVGCTEFKSHGFTMSEADHQNNLAKFTGMAADCPHFEDKDLVDTVTIGLQSLGFGGGRREPEKLDASLFLAREVSRGSLFANFVASETESNPEFKAKVEQAIAERTVKEAPEVVAGELTVDAESKDKKFEAADIPVFGSVLVGGLAQRIMDWVKRPGEGKKDDFIIRDPFLTPPGKEELVAPEELGSANPYEVVDAKKIAVFTVEPAMSFRNVDNAREEQNLLKELYSNSGECCEAGVFARIADNGQETYAAVKESMSVALAAKEGYFELAMAPNSLGSMDPEEARAGMRQYYRDLMNGLDAYSDGATAALDRMTVRQNEQGVVPDLEKSKQGLAYVNCAYGAAVMDSLRRMDDKYHFMTMEDWMSLDNTHAYGVEGLANFKAGDDLVPNTIPMGYTTEELNNLENLQDYAEVGGAAGLFTDIFKNGKKPEEKKELEQPDLENIKKENLNEQDINKDTKQPEQSEKPPFQTVLDGGLNTLHDTVHPIVQPLVDSVKSLGETIVEPFKTLFQAPDAPQGSQAPVKDKDYGKMAEDQLLSDELKKQLDGVSKDDLDDGFDR